MRITPIEGVHYIFDRYAYLTGAAKPEVPFGPDTPAEALHKAIRTIKADNHPDTYTRAASNVMATMRDNYAKAEECERILLHPERRQHFDAQLAEFKAKRPQAISRSGAAIEIIGDDYFSHTQLLEAEQDFSELNKIMFDVGNVPTDDELDELRALYAENPAGMRAVLRRALSAVFKHLKDVEASEWRPVGQWRSKPSGKTLAFYGEDITAAVEEDIDTARAAIAESLDRHRQMLAIGLTREPILMITHDDGSSTAATVTDTTTGETLPAVPSDADMADILAHAQAVYDLRIQRVRAAAEKRVKVMEELADVADTSPLTTIDNTNPNHLLIQCVQRDGKWEPYIGFRFFIDIAHSEPVHLDAEDMAAFAHLHNVPATTDQLKAAAAAHGGNVWLLRANPALMDTPLFEILAFGSYLAGEWQKNNPVPDADAVTGPAGNDPNGRPAP
jgi:hypothetical protein